MTADDRSMPEPARAVARADRYRAALRRWSIGALAVGTLATVAAEVAGGAWPIVLVTPLARQVAALFVLGAIGLLVLRVADRSLPSRRAGTLKWAWPASIALLGVYAILVALGVAPWRVAPALPRVATNDRDLGTLKVLSANVHSSNLDHASLLKLITDERPDVVLLMEVNSAWLRSLRAIEADYSVRERVADDFGNFGIGVWSRLPGEARLVVRQRLAVPSLLDVAHAELTLRLGERRVRVVGVHPLPPITPARAGARDALLTSVADDVARSGEPTIVAGDFNATRYCGIARDVARHGHLADATADIGTSWPMTLARPVLGIRIDQIWATRDDWRVVDAHAGRAIGSDHLPMIATLRLVRASRGDGR